MRYSPKPTDRWVGFDFDGTLVTHKFPDIGEPVPLMIKRLKRYLQLGVRVKIMTARGGDPVQVELLKNWCSEQGLPRLEVTNQKDYLMVRLYDDRARQVVKNKGIVVGEDL